MIVNKSEAAEREWLEEIKERLEDAYENVDQQVADAADNLREQKSYLYENKTGMDAAEKAAVKQSVNMQAISGEAAVAYKKRLLKLMETPWFGRIDFREDGRESDDVVYVGIHSFTDEEGGEPLIHDWRAPVSSMFYDFEPGKASFEAPSGVREGEIVRKRQYRIRKGELEMMLESDLYIRDDVLQKELSRSADDRMKNIVATIQRDQNAIIRDESSPVLIIQGVAGSGKTSIALHRIAFLLYRFKDTLESRDLMVLSPNRVFSDYISNVLPELGEETIPEMEMEDLAEYVLNGKYRFQTFFDQVDQLLETHDPEAIVRMEFKAGSEFLQKLKAYANWLKRERLQEEDIPVRYKVVPARFIREKYNANTHLPLMKRATAISAEVIRMVKRTFRYDLKASEKKEIRDTVKGMMGSTNLRVLYKDFYDWLERPDMFQYAKGSVYEYADLFPLIFLKMQMEGVETFRKVKHLIVDEMQDYTAVQYAVLARLFPCNKTILGDANQNVNPYSSTDAGTIQGIFSDAVAVALHKSYRSTWEITRFSSKISPGTEVEPVERHGEEPRVERYGSEKEERAAILEEIARFKDSEYQSMGILCKTRKQAKRLATWLQKRGEEVHHLTPGSTTMEVGVVVTAIHLAKGLEFDRVIVPGVDADRYHTEVDRSMLYIACTRAMHELLVTGFGEQSPFLEKLD